MNETADEWKRIGSKKIADCRVFSIHEVEFERVSDAEKATFFLMDNPDWVNVVALTPEHEVVLIEQFRYGSESLIVEIPGGIVDEGESPASTVERELSEETGYRAGRVIPIGCSYPNPAIQGNKIYHYLALDCKRTDELDLDEHESIATRLVPLHEVDDLVHNGIFTHSLAITALYYAQRYLKNEGIPA